MAFQVMARHPRWRSWIALVLAACVLGSVWMDVVPLVAERATPASPAGQKNYETMTLSELRGALKTIPVEIDELGSRVYDDLQPILKERTQLITEKIELYGTIDNQRALLLNETNARNQFNKTLEELKIVATKPDMTRLAEHDQKIAGFEAEIRQCQARQAQITDELVAWEIRNKPAFEANKLKIAAGQAELIKEATRIAEVAKRRFGKNAVWEFEVDLGLARAMEPVFSETVAAETVRIPEAVQSSVAVVEPQPESRAGYLWRTLKRGLIDVVYEKIPNFAGSAQQVLLVAFEDGKAKVANYLLGQGRAEAASALANAPAPVRANAGPAIDAVVDAYAETVSRIVVDNGNRVMNSQTIEVKTVVAEGRSVASWWEGVKTGMNSGRFGKAIFGVNVLFVAVAVWDIGSLFMREGWQAAGVEAGKFAGISTALWLASKAGTLAEITVAGTGGLLAVVILMDLWRRFVDFAVETKDYFTERPYIRFILDGEPCVMDGPMGQQVNMPRIGFFNFRMSPAYGLSRDTWFLKYPNQASLNQALRDYRNGLAAVFLGHWNVPPMFDPGDNMVMFEKLVGREWKEKWTAYRKQVQEQLQKIKEQIAARQSGLSYPVQNLPIPEPAGHVFNVSMITDAPTTGIDIEFFEIYGVTGLPGDTLNVTVRSEVVRSDGAPAGLQPKVETKAFALKVAEGIKVYSGSPKFRLGSPGDYELIVTLDFDKPGTKPAPVRLPFKVERPRIPTACGFDFGRADGAEVELRERVNVKLNGAIPSLPFIGQSNFPKDKLPLADPRSGKYLAENTNLVPIPGGSKEDFSLAWDVGFNIENSTDPNIAANRQGMRDTIEMQLKKSQDFMPEPLGIFSWLGASAVPGTLDPDNYGDPYMSRAQIKVYDCLTMTVDAGLSSHPLARTYGPRNNPAVIDAMRAAAKQSAIGAGRVLHIAAMAALQETLPLMRERAKIPVPTPGIYVGQMQASQYSYAPERTMTMAVQAATGTTVAFEGDVRFGGETYPIKGVWDKVRNEISGRLTYPGTSKEQWLSGRYEQYRRAFRIEHSFTTKNDKGQDVNTSFDYLCRFQ